jgi:hypothetical protein
MNWLRTPKGKRNVKMLLPSEYDRNKEIVLIGKGPTCRYVKTDDSMYTCCLNTSGRMTDRINFQFLGDLYIYEQFLKIPNYFDKIENLVIPLRFNLENKGDTLAYDLIKDTLPEHINVFNYTFNFHPYPETEDVRMYSVISSGETAVAWLLDEGFKSFKTTGIDPYAPDNVRHSVFENNGEGNWLHPNPRGGMKISYDRSVYRVQQFGGTFQTIGRKEYA